MDLVGLELDLNHEFGQRQALDLEQVPVGNCFVSRGLRGSLSWMFRS